MDNLIKKLNIVDNKIQISDFEIIECIQQFQNPTNKFLKSLYYFYFISAILNNLIDPNFLLSILISKITNVENNMDYYALLLLPLRFGANPNIYIYSKFGNIHILVYLVLTLQENRINKNIMEFLLYAFIIKGSDVLQYTYLQKDISADVSTPIDNSFINKIRGENKDTTFSPKDIINKPIIDWLYETNNANFKKVGTSNKLVNVTDLYEIIFNNNNISLNTKKILTVICDSPEYALNIKDHGLFDIDLIIKYRCLNLLKAIPNIQDYGIVKEIPGGEFSGIKYCISICWLEGFIYFIDIGLDITYFSINRLLLLLQNSYTVVDNIAKKNLTDMLIYSIEKGTHIDIEQLNIISMCSKELETDIKSKYSTPMWKKICNNNNKITNDNLKKLAFNLNLDYSDSKSAICNNLKDINDLPDKGLLKQSAINRQQKRISSDVSLISNFINGEAPNLVCSNMDDGFEYNDPTMAYYKDDKGNLWCFLSNMYESLIKSKINPSSREPLPENFIYQLNSKLTILTNIGILPSLPKKISETIDELSKEDIISNIESNYIIDTIYKTGAIYGITEENFKKLSSLDMNNLLSFINMKLDDSILLTFTTTTTDNKVLTSTVMTYNHILTTFCRAIYFKCKNDVKYASIFFNHFNKLLKK